MKNSKNIQNQPDSSGEKREWITLDEGEKIEPKIPKDDGAEESFEPKRSEANEEDEEE